MDQHDVARRWLTARYEDPDELVGLCWPVLYSFARLLTSRRVMRDDAVPLVGAWEAAAQFLHQENARLVEPGETHLGIARDLIRTPGLTSNDVPDVQIAALAIEHGLTLCTHDRGFARFDRLSWTDPLNEESPT